MSSLPHVIEDCMGILQLYNNGTIFRSDNINFPSPMITDDSVVFRDVLYDVENNLHLRLYKPTISNRPKLPLLYFLHGGGFCVGSNSWPSSHNSCLRLASGLDAFIISPSLRLAPEHRLPAAMDDALSAIQWLQKQGSLSADADAWLNAMVDFDQVFIVGDSSGGNIGHHLAVGFGSNSYRFDPVRVRGYILMAPFFGGMERTKSEEGTREEYLDLEALDRFWRLSLPIGEDRDHPMANPFGPKSISLEAVALEPILVMVGENEILKDRVENYAKRLKQFGKKVDYIEFKGKQHGFFTLSQNSEFVDEVVQIIKRFMLHNSL